MGQQVGELQGNAELFLSISGGRGGGEVGISVLMKILKCNVMLGNAEF